MRVRSNWNMAWKSFCDVRTHFPLLLGQTLSFCRSQLVQDQEEERLEFLKSRMWDYANGLSTLAMAEDEVSAT